VKRARSSLVVKKQRAIIEHGRDSGIKKKGRICEAVLTQGGKQKRKKNPPFQGKIFERGEEKGRTKVLEERHRKLTPKGDSFRKGPSGEENRTRCRDTERETETF